MDYRFVSKKAHTSPGSLIYTGEISFKTYIKFIHYDESSYFSQNYDRVKDLPKLENKGVYWINFVGLSDLENISDICRLFSIHPLVAEDLLNTSHRPKIEKYEDFIFLICKNMFLKDEIITNQISFILLDNIVISFQEKENDIFKDVFRRLEDGSNIRKFNSHYLLYALLDAVVDSYFILLEDVDIKIDSFEDILLQKPNKELLDNIYSLKRSLIYVKSMVWPMRNIVETLIKNEDEIMNDRFMYYYRDIYDHIIQILDLTQNARDICSGMLDTYLSSIGNKTNDIMRVLTIASTIAIPLTFLTGLYGMNFKYFPSLDWKYAYPTFWIVSILIVIIMFFYFKKKEWI